MFRHCLPAAGTLLALLPAAAFAQDKPSHDSTGAHIEAVIGFENAAFDSVDRANGLLYGIGAGYDVGWKRFRLGLEGEVSDSTARSCYLLGSIPGSICLRTSRDLYVGARFGAEITPGITVYGKAGYSNYGESNRFFIPPDNFVTNPHSDGIRLGGGAEFAVGKHTFLKAEYRYSLYERSQNFDKHQALMGFGVRF
ncbi:MAG: outer membrane protein [Allosphingosinicella sp.]